MLTTGGGWQDQVGGLSPGIKVGHSKAEIPVKVDVTFLKVSDETIRSFGNQLVLVYTGKTRLARNLLQVICLKQSNFKKIIMTPTCICFVTYLIVHFHFHLCITGIPPDVHKAHCL